MRVAMWSGPRNLSTAMMYAFAARGDCAVVDEPFYGAYLCLTGADHPMRAEILASMECDADKVAPVLIGSNPAQKPHFYQKHMTHHMVEGIPRGWMRDVRNVFLIRHPARVIASYTAKRQDPTADDLGFARQAELFDQVCQITGAPPLVIDSFDIRADPGATLRALCAALGLPWTEAMLTWEPGGIAQDGVWAAHWYGAVHASTGFAGAEGPLPEVAQAPAHLLDDALAHYEALRAHRLGAD